MRSTSEREHSRMQRLLLEGIKLVADHPRSPHHASALDGMKLLTDHPRLYKVVDEATLSIIPEAATQLPNEVFGHLAEALRPGLVSATDDQLLMLTAPRFAKMTSAAFILGMSPQGMHEFYYIKRSALHICCARCLFVLIMCL